MKDKNLIHDSIVEEEILDYHNPKLSIDNRVSDLLNRMTLKEKVAQMVCSWNQKKAIAYDENGELDFSKMEVSFNEGIGQIGRISDTWKGMTPLDTIKLANAIQKYLVEKTRLGIPAIFHEECLHGLAAMDATSYPQPIGMASTFNPKIVESIYSAIAEDARTRGAHQALTPVVDVVRDPRWGRVEETFGEDPYLVTEMGKAAVNGFQGDRSFKNKNKVLATLKHFAAHGQPESGSNCGPANISERILRDTFFIPFKEVIEECKPYSVMASYNEIDGLPSHMNKWLLKDVLRKEWKFDGFIVSDYYAITELFGKHDSVSHAVAKDRIEAAYLSVQAGVNIELPEMDCYPYLVELVENGRIDESILDELIAPMLRAKFELGLFEQPYTNTDSFDNDTKLVNDRGIALKAAQETIILLKNENELLPLNINDTKTIAVIGPNADRVLLGGYSGKPKYNTTVLSGIRKKVGENVEILYSEGCKITIDGSWEEDVVTPPDPEQDQILIKEAVEIAHKADYVVLAIGGNEQTSREAYTVDHMGDRPSLDLVGRQNELVRAIKETGKPTIVVLFNGRPKSINYISENIPAILECWYLGQESGNAVADVLFGDVNPSGKLPISIPRSVGHIPCFYNHKPSARRGYLFDEISALYPFGFGLSYTEFKIDNLKLHKNNISITSSTTVSVDIQNVGDFYGEEVVQMYIRDLVSSVTRPVKELKGFEKIGLQPGEKKTLTFEILPKHLAFTDVNMNFTVEPGEFQIMVGNSSRAEDLQKVMLEVI